MKIGLIREGKIPADNRVPFTPAQCKLIQKHFDIKIFVQPSDKRCINDKEYEKMGIPVIENLNDCDILMGIKEVPVQMLIPGKTYFFFSHTKKLQPHNQSLMHAIVENKITLIDYECLEHEDGTRVLGFGFFAGIVGAHNGMMAYGKRTDSFHLNRVNSKEDFRHLIHTYFGLKLPHIKIAVTGSGRVAHGVLEIMNLLGVHEVEPDEYLELNFTYPVYVHLKGADLYEHRAIGGYNRIDFHANPTQYVSRIHPYLSRTDILMNGVYWEKNIPRLFEFEEMCKDDFKIATIADISDDLNGSVPSNLGDSTIDDPIYGVDRQTFKKTAPYLPGSVDMMTVSNLPNELPKDASRYFGEQLIKYVLPEIGNTSSKLINHAMITKHGELNKGYEYMTNYASENT